MKALITLALVLVASVASNTYAASGQSPFFTDPFLGTSARQAYLSIQKDPFVASMLRDGEHVLSFAKQERAHGIETHKFQDFYRGLEVIGSMALLHQGPFDQKLTNRIARFDLDVSPTVSANEALSLALGGSDAAEAKALAAPLLKILPSEEQDSARLVYWVKTTDGEFAVDAHSGEIALSIPAHYDLAPVDVFQATSSCQSVDEDGFPTSYNLENCTQTVTAGRIARQADTSARQAAGNARRTLEYYSGHHDRDSYDDRGSNLVSVVHIGEKFANAFWNSQENIMAYGDGDGKNMGDLTAAVDVAGHEMTHGVVSQTAQLIYAGQSGALNEAYADFFGKLIAADDDWMMGRKVFLPTSGRTGIRDLKDPRSLTARFRNEDGTTVQKAYPATYSERFIAFGACDRSRNDNCYVHVNSTIWSHGAYRVVLAVGQEKAEKLYYLTLTQYLSSRATFIEASQQTQVACSQLYDSGTCAKVKEALSQVGL